MSEQLLAAARSHWALGDVPIKLIAARENHVYKVDNVAATDRPAALRIHRPGYRTSEEINSELVWMEMLSEHGTPVPEPIPATDGTFILVSNGTVVDLLTWIEAPPLDRNAETEAGPEPYYFELGRLMANMHKLADSWRPPVNFARPTWDLIGDEPTWGRFWENPSLTSAQTGKFQNFRSYAKDQLAILDNQGALDFGLIHADLIPENVLGIGTLLHPIDFDDGGYGYRLFDLATTTHRCKRLPKAESLSEAVIEGYRTVRPLNTDALPLFEALRASTYVGWNISRLEEPDAVQRNAIHVAEAETAIDALSS